MTKTHAWIWWLGLVVLPSVARADPKDDARRHFQAALRAAASEDFRAAVDAFLAAYAAIPHPVTAFNIARTYQNLGQDEDALFWFRKVRDLDPARAEEVDPIIATLQERLAPPAPAPESATSVEGLDDESARARLAALEAEQQALRDRLGLDRAAPQDEDPPPRDAAQATEVPAVELDMSVDEGEGTADADADADGAPAGDVDEVPAEDEAPPPSEEALALEDLDPYQQVIVTASRYGQDPLDSPQSVTVLSGDAIRMSGAVHIADALRRAVGVDMMAMSSGVPWLGIRNFNTEMNNKVLWLVDGRPAMLAFLGTALPFTLGVTIEEIDRIEVIRGPGSAIYGANAVTGVINIITRQPGEGPAFEAVGQYGNNQYARTSAVASGRTGRVSYRMSAGFQQEGRFETELEDVDEAPNVLPFRDDDIGDRRVHLGGRVDTTFADKGWASLSGSWDAGHAEYYSKAALGNFGLDGEFGTIRGDLSYGPFHARAFYQREAGRTRSWLSSTGQQRSTEARVQDDLANVQLEGDFAATTGAVQHRLLVGATYEFRQYRAGQEGFGFEIPRLENHFAGFANYTLNWKAVQANASLRVDKHALLQAQQTISPRGALVFRVAPKTSLRMSGGTAFRAMNGLESYVNLQLNTAADGYFVEFFGAATDPRGQTLGPERIANAEIGVRDESSAIHSLDVVAYWNQVTRLIDIGSVEPVLRGFQEDGEGWPFGRTSWINNSTVFDAVGGEIDLTLFPTDGLDIFGNLSVSRVFGRDPTLDEAFVDNSNGLVKANVGVQYRSPWRFDLSVATHFTSQQMWRVPEFDARGGVVVNLRPIPARVLMVTRLVGHVLDSPDLELGVTLWNPVGFAGGFLEHPNGQRVGPRLYGHMGVKF